MLLAVGGCLGWLGLPLRLLELPGGGIGGEDGNAAGLGIELGEAFDDQGVLRVLHRLCDASPLLACDVERVGRDRSSVSGSRPE